MDSRRRQGVPFRCGFVYDPLIGHGPNRKKDRLLVIANGLTPYQQAGRLAGHALDQSMHRMAILLDGGFVKHRLGTREQPLESAETVAELVLRLAGYAHPLLQRRELHRVYWYDAELFQRDLRNPISKRSSGTKRDHLAKANARLLVALKASPMTSVRAGECQHRGWHLTKDVLAQANDGPAGGEERRIEVGPDDIEPSIEQKGVDMRIGIDVCTLVLKKHVDAILLVSGDADMVPVMKLARREGALLFLAALGYNVHPAMTEHSDLRIEFPFDDLKTTHSSHRDRDEA